MPSYDFRLPFRLPRDIRIECKQDEFLIMTEPDGKQIKLRSGQKGTPINAIPQASIIGGSYTSIESAQKVAEQVKKALLMWSVSQKIGIDFDDGKPKRPRGILTDYGLKLFASKMKLNKPVRNAVPSLDIYEHQEDLLFMSFEADVILGKKIDALTEQVIATFRKPPVLTENQILSSELYCASFFDISFRSRLITLVTAIEALLDPQKKPDDIQKLVYLLELTIQQAEIKRSDKDSMLGSMKWLKFDSIGESGREITQKLLGNRLYMNMDAPHFFTYCYRLRSEILHTGEPEDKEVSLPSVANTCQAFVADLLMSSFNLSPVKMNL